LLESVVRIEKVLYGLSVGGFLTEVIVRVKVLPAVSPALFVKALEMVIESVPEADELMEVTNVGDSPLLATEVT
jgi:hypothetical protein